MFLLNQIIDHTNLSPTLSTHELLESYREALKYRFRSLCIAPCNLQFLKNKLQKIDVRLCTVISFPLGYQDSRIKGLEVKKAIECGADEVDFVINIGRLKERNYDYIANELKIIRESAGDKVLKAIIEECYLEDFEIIKISEMLIKSKIDYVKTSSGFGPSGASLKTVKLIKDTFKDGIKIKAAGGIKTLYEAEKFIECGADVLGLSRSVRIMEEFNNREK